MEDAFIESLTSEHDKLVQMGIIRSSRDQALYASGPKDLKGKGKQQKNPKTKFKYPNPKVENQSMMSLSAQKRTKEKGIMESKYSSVHTAGRASTLNMPT